MGNANSTVTDCDRGQKPEVTRVDTMSAFARETLQGIGRDPVNGAPPRQI